MARYKAIKPKDKRHELAKKRERIRTVTAYICFALVIICLIIGGINQQNAPIAGWSMIIMGIIILALATFILYTEKKGWQPLFPYDYCEESVRHACNEIRKHDLENYRAGIFILITILFLLGIGVIIAGILRLFGINIFN